MAIDKRRVRILNDIESLERGPVVYVMAREQRVKDNWALIHALEQANKRCVPLLVLFVVAPAFNHGSARHNQWMVASLQNVEKELRKHKIPFFVRTGNWVETVQDFSNKEKVSLLVLDFNPLRPVRKWRDGLVSKLTRTRIEEVDARNIIPCWFVSDKIEFAAHTFRPKVKKVLKEFLLPYPRIVTIKKPYLKTVPDINWEQVCEYRKTNHADYLPDIFVPGSDAGEKMVKDFVNKHLSGYANKRNNPNKSDGVSHLSPYLRWGNISAQSVALKVNSSSAPKVDKDAFLEELIVRRELSDNFCFYNKDYDKVAGAHQWAKDTIAKHALDKREYLYTKNEFEQAKTHDHLWNAAQRQMMKEGKMHGYLRMYWAKKILEWTKNAQSAIDIALYLNDKYELDGRDSNGVVGVMWSICGVHDRAWGERPIFGKIRYMNYAGCKRKFDTRAFEVRYGQD